MFYTYRSLVHKIISWQYSPIGAFLSTFLTLPFAQLQTFCKHLFHFIQRLLCKQCIFLIFWDKNIIISFPYILLIIITLETFSMSFLALLNIAPSLSNLYQLLSHCRHCVSDQWHNLISRLAIFQLFYIQISSQKIQLFHMSHYVWLSVKISLHDIFLCKISFSFLEIFGVVKQQAYIFPGTSHWIWVGIKSTFLSCKTSPV